MKKGLIYLGILSMVLGITAFQCASAELTGAKLYINQKQYDKAKEALLKEVQKNPASDEGWYLLGVIYGEESNYTKMIDAFNNSLKASKKYEPQIKDSRQYYWATSFNKGVIHFNNATKSTVEDSTKLYFGKAETEFQNAIACEPDSIISYQNLAYVYLNQNRIDDAIVPLEHMVKIGTSPEAFSMLGQIYTENGNVLIDKFKESKVAADSVKAFEWFDKAIVVLEKGKTKFPNDGEILLRLSNAYIAANKLDVAMGAFKEGVEREPNNQYYHYNYGVLLLNANKYTEAEAEFKRAIEIDPEYINAVYNLGVVYVRWGSEIREKAEAEGKGDMSYQEKFKAAIPLMEKYLEKNPKEAVIWELLGKIYANLGMTDKSKDAFQKADELRK
ncbi:MAG: tetratricopeptide repeat protein [Ignavibacteria bacterium]|nr:tetratricopeptide repeat protein [Ignavibacteria bacterium]